MSQERIESGDLVVDLIGGNIIVSLKSNPKVALMVEPFNNRIMISKACRTNAVVTDGHTRNAGDTHFHPVISIVDD